MNKTVAIDLTWIRHKIVGGTESYTMNLLDGFVSLNDPEIDYFFVISKNNKDLFSKYETNERIKIYAGNFSSMNRIIRLLWQNFRLGSVLKRYGINICIEPMYCKPFFAPRNIKFITTVHDLQAAHYPEYFSKTWLLWIKAAWRNAIYTSQKIVVTSEYVKKDILARYKVNEEKLVLNYDPVTIYDEETAPIEKLHDFGVEDRKYYYMVTSLQPHKNIDTVIKALYELKRKNSQAFLPLVISGVGGRAKDKLRQIASDSNVENDIIFTPFISNAERNLLYKHCKTFLAPSLFEGFGLPPVEAMLMGAPVVTTMETCSHEITGGLVSYVKDAKSAQEWCKVLESNPQAPDVDDVNNLTAKYTKESVAGIFNKLIKGL